MDRTRDNQLKETYVYANIHKDKEKPPEIIWGRKIEKNNMVVIINGDDNRECEAIKKELMQFIRKTRIKHKFGFAVVKLHGRGSRLAKLFQYLFDFD